MSECITTPVKSPDTANKPVCLVFGSAEIKNPGFIFGYIPADCSYRVLCADGGLKNALSAGLRVDAVIGDGDSGGIDCPEGAACVRLAREKDMTDLQACLDYGLSAGMDSFVLFGCTGGRLDHFIGNVFLLEYLSLKGAKGILADELNEIHYHLPGTITFEKCGDFAYLSVIALDSVLSGVTLEGLRYPLDNATVLRSETLGISNEPVGSVPVSVSTQKGAALIIRSRDKA